MLNNNDSPTHGIGKRPENVGALLERAALGQDYSVSFLPAESNTGMFGGNSNWRGPIWVSMNGLIAQ